MKSPIHHLRRAHAAVKHHAALVHHLLRHHAGGVIPELTVLAVLVLLPFTYSPFNTDPHRFGATFLLLAGVTILSVSLAVRYLVTMVKRHKFEDATSVSEAGTSHQSETSRQAPLTEDKMIAITTAVFLLLLILSGNRALSLNSTLGGVGLALFFLYAVKSTFHEVASCKRAEQAWVFALGITAAFWLIFQSPLFTKIDGGLGQTKIFNAAWTQAKVFVRPQPLATTTPDYLTSLRVAVGSLINSPLKGSGLGHYANAFAMYRGAEFNRSTSWNLQFTHSASTLTDWVTEGGVLGLIVYLLIFIPGWVIVIRGLKRAGRKFSWPEAGVAALTVVSLAYSFPLANYVLYLMGLVIISPSLRGGEAGEDPSLALGTGSAISARLPRSLRSLAMTGKAGLLAMTKKILDLARMTAARLPRRRLPACAGRLAMTEGVRSLARTNGIKALIFLALPALAIYLFVPIMMADHYFDQSRQVLNADSAQPAYLLLQKAIAADPGNDTYHRAYAQLNLSLANAVGNTDQATSAKLVQQATREIKIAVSLNPESWDNQATAGTFYETLASANGSGAGAEENIKAAAALAESSLLLAAKYNPFDPPSHLNLGGYYFFFKKDLVRAKAEVEKAISLKDDYADAHYALSVVYRQTGETAKAIEELKKVLTLFPVGSPNYNQVQSELQTVENTLKNPPPQTPSPKTP